MLCYAVLCNCRVYYVVCCYLILWYANGDGSGNGNGNGNDNGNDIGNDMVWYVMVCVGMGSVVWCSGCAMACYVMVLYGVSCVMWCVPRWRPPQASSRRPRRASSGSGWGRRHSEQHTLPYLYQFGCEI